MLVGATNSPNYQWSQDGVSIPGATSFFYVIRSASEEDAGVYQVEATNVCNSAASSPAVVDVIDCDSP